VADAYIDAQDITDAMIERLVRSFYSRIRQDERLGPIFVEAIGTDWEPHLLRMIDFWSSLMLRTGRYSGSPLRKHTALVGVTPDDFQIWLRLFNETALAICGERTAPKFMERAERIAQSFQMAMFYDPREHGPTATRP
jgi:hemoglobin